MITYPLWEGNVPGVCFQSSMLNTNLDEGGLHHRANKEAHDHAEAEGLGLHWL